MTRTVRWLGMGFCLVSACGSDAKEDEGLSWKGEELHLAFTGTLDGDELEVDLSGSELDAAHFNCTLEYEVEAGKPETARMIEAKINALLDIGGESRFLEFELKYHDLTRDEIGDSVKVVPREGDSTSSADELVCEWEWHSWDEAMQVDVDTLFEQSAQQGKVTLELFEGLPVEGAAKPGEVKLGATVDVAFSVDEKLKISFTALCGDVLLTEI